MCERMCEGKRKDKREREREIETTTQTQTDLALEERASGTLQCVARILKSQ